MHSLRTHLNPGLPLSQVYTLGQLQRWRMREVGRRLEDAAVDVSPVKRKAGLSVMAIFRLFHQEVSRKDAPVALQRRLEGLQWRLLRDRRRRALGLPR